MHADTVNMLKNLCYHYGCNVNTTIVDFNLDLEQQHLLVNMLKPGDLSEGRYSCDNNVFYSNSQNLMWNSFFVLENIDFWLY